MSDTPPHEADWMEASQPVVAIETLFAGFEQAFTRWQPFEVPTTDAGAAYIPLFETLEWAAAVDERLAYMWDRTGAKPPPYLTWSPDLRGLRWARNRVRHDWAFALEVRANEDLVLAEGVTAYPGNPYEWAWRERLPERELVRGARTDESFYKEHLAGQPARVTLNLVRAFFLSYQDLTLPA